MTGGATTPPSPPVSEGVRQGRLQWMPFHWLKAVRGARI